MHHIMFKALSPRILKANLLPTVVRSSLPIVSKVAVSHRSLAISRSYSAATESKPAAKGDQPPRPNGKVLLVLAALAIGSTVFSLSYQKNDPAEFLEEAPTGDDSKETTKPAFSPDQVSVVFVLGGPGAGKGTQCAKLVKDYQFVHLSAGDLLRAERNREGSKYGEMISHYIKEGLIVPQEVTVELLKQAIRENYEKGKTKFLVDGFPRKMDQAITFEKQIVPSKFTLFFDCPERVMLQRLIERGKTSGRDDDNIDSIKKRFKTFVDTSMPVVDYFSHQSKVVKLSCDHSVDEVYKQVQEAVEGRLGK